jgi:hypothetical protein
MTESGRTVTNHRRILLGLGAPVFSGHGIAPWCGKRPKGVSRLSGNPHISTIFRQLPHGMVFEQGTGKAVGWCCQEYLEQSEMSFCKRVQNIELIPSEMGTTKRAPIEVAGSLFGKGIKFDPALTSSTPENGP